MGQKIILPQIAEVAIHTFKLDASKDSIYDSDKRFEKFTDSIIEPQF